MLFTGEHSTILINLDHVVFAETPGHGGDDMYVQIHFINGMTRRLRNGNARMFMDAWRTHSEDQRQNRQMADGLCQGSS